MDEEGGWPWREQERDRGVWGVEETATTASPLYSATSNNSGSSGVSPALEAVRPKPTHNRTRSKTESHSPAPRTAAAAVPSPRRSSTIPTPSRIPVGKSAVVSQRGNRRTGTTPPLVPGQANKGDGHEADADDGDDDDDGDLRLLTPPPTPPFTARMFSFSLGGSADAPPYFPSPYKTRNSPAGAGGVVQTVGSGRKKLDAHSKLDGMPSIKKAPAGLVLGSPRRPRNPPVRTLHHHSSSSDVGGGHDDDGAADASCSSSGRSSSNSQASFPASDDLPGLAAHHHHRRPPPHSPTAAAAAQQLLVHPERPQFNARKASARCRAMEGYVSFASVEGLGEPPADPMSPDGAGVVEGEDGVKARSGVLGLGAAGVAAWGGWRKLLGVAGVVGAPGHEQQPGVVL